MMMDKKGAEKVMEIIIVTIILIMLLFIILAIVGPRLSKISVVDKCPRNLGVCVSRYGGMCKSHVILEDYKCEHADQICCKYDKEQQEAYENNEQVLVSCNRNGKENKEPCVCYSTDDEFNTEIIDNADEFGAYSRDCSVASEMNPTRYCLVIDKEVDGEKNPLYDKLDLPKDIDEKIDDDTRQQFVRLCFENNPLAECVDDGVTENSACDCDENGAISTDDCSGDNKYCHDGKCTDTKLCVPGKTLSRDSQEDEPVYYNVVEDCYIDYENRIKCLEGDLYEHWNEQPNVCCDPINGMCRA